MLPLDSLNPQQREAVLATDGPLLVLAGAGSGKTRVVITRIAHLILDKGVAPGQILAVTFTNKAADEMRERVRELLAREGSADGPMPTLSTFHSFCARLLRQYGAPLAELRTGFTPDFQILDEQDRLAVIKALCKSFRQIPETIRPSSIAGAISRSKSTGSSSELLVRGESDQMTRWLRAVYRAYEAELLASNALDFDDLLIEAVRLLQGFEAVRERVQDRYRYLLVDEYQDTNRPQYDLMRLLLGPERNVCVVGDEDQTIYSWRGAHIRNILGFESDFAGAKVVRLEQNYRSTGAILAAASELVAHNCERMGKRLWTDGEEGDRPVVFRARDAHSEAAYVAQALGRWLECDPDLHAAVLYRTNAQSRLIEEALRRAKLEFLVVGGTAFYQRAEIKDLLAYLKVAVSPADVVSLQRIINVPARGIGHGTLESLRAIASEAGVSLWEAIEDAVDRRLVPHRAYVALDRFRSLIAGLRERVPDAGPLEALQDVLKQTQYVAMLEADASPEASDRIENVQELVVAARESSQRDLSVREFLDQAALVAASDRIDMNARIQLMTLHNSKGLEFPAVAIVGLEEELLPHGVSMAEGSIEEERRLCYVGMTRARRHLLLTSAELRGRFGSNGLRWMAASRFLKEIPPENLDILPPDNDKRRFGQAMSRAPMTRTKPRPAAGNGSGMPRTLDSVEAVKGFFRQRSREDGSGPPAAPPPAEPTGGAMSDRPAAPKLGQSLQKLRRQGPFAKGTTVRHAKFGVGVVQRRDGEGPSAKLSVHFPGHGLKRLVAKYAQLQEV